MPADQSADSAPDQQAVALVIPDCCNLGVVFRTLIAVNLAVMVAILLRTDILIAAAGSFVESSMLIEPACFLSLLILCGLYCIGHLMSPVLQRLLCALVPALVTLAVIRLLFGFDWFRSGFTHLSAPGGPRRRWKIWPI